MHHTLYTIHHTLYTTFLQLTHVDTYTAIIFSVDSAMNVNTEDTADVNTTARDATQGSLNTNNTTL
jgi:hypothetical protein